ncbi:pyocin knob domain-containing S74 family peptidase [Enterobacter ludwigii]|uniref:pyocin knob domain-containing S74 family peptidase n=1 Tax=Enterobacter ludwigii TaxID=299767 RepID=UPI002FD5015F
MSDIITGQGLNLQYNTDTGNRSPQGVGNVTINEVNTFPVLTIKSESNTFETYNSEYKTVLLSDGAVDPFQIVVNYLPDDPTHQFLDTAAEDQTLFQMIIQYDLNMDESTITYAIVNGYITSTALNGDKDSVVTKSYTFQAEAVAARMMTTMALLPIYQGDYGVGSNTTDVPQYAPTVPTGNSFIKVPSTQAGNPAGADMMGVGLVDGTSVAEFAMTKTGTLSLYAKNATTAWTRIYTATQMDARYVPLTRTINGKPLSTNLTLDDLDVYAKDVVDDLYAETLKKASNLSDVASVESAKVNLGVNKLQQSSASTNLNYPTKNASLVLRDSDLAWGVFDSTANQWSALGVGQGGTGSITAAGARSNLGLGTAAIQNVGTSGATVPLLNGANVFSGATRFDAPQTSFAQTSTSSGNGIEIGSTTTTALSYIDLHSSGNATDYDVRIYASGGSTTTGQGNLTINAGSVTMPNLALSTDLAILHGGTGASTYDQALVNLNAAKFQRNSLGNTDNLNDFDGANPGFFYCATNAAATTANNYPVLQAGSLLVQRNGANGVAGCTQMYFPYNSNDIYVRTYLYGSPGSWTGWSLMLQQGSFGVGYIGTVLPSQQTNQFISESDGATTWAPANGAGFQTSYANNRLFQMMMTTSDKAYIRFNDSGDPKIARTTKPWTPLLVPGSYGLGADLTVNPSTPIANLNETTPTGFYYTANESTLGGVTSDATYVLANRGGRPTAHASKYVQQRSWNGYFMGTSGWAWREQAQLESNQTFTGSNTFNGDSLFTGYITNTASNPLAIRSINPTLSFVETDSSPANSSYMFVADGGNFRLNRDNTGGTQIFGYTRSSNTSSFGTHVAISGDLQTGASAIRIPSAALSTSDGVATGGYRAIEAGADYAGFDNMNNINITSWYGIGFCTAYNVPTNGVVAGKPAVYINTRNGTLAAKNAVYANTTQLTSDRNAKDNIVEIEDESIEKYLNLKTYTFEFKNSGQTSAGFIAQEVQDVFPDFVQFVDDIGHLTLDYNAMTAHTHRALVAVNEKVKEQAIKIETLESTIQDQQVQIDELKALVQSLLDNK